MAFIRGNTNTSYLDNIPLMKSLKRLNFLISTSVCLNKCLILSGYKLNESI